MRSQFNLLKTVDLENEGRIPASSEVISFWTYSPIYFWKAGSKDEVSENS